MAGALFFRYGRDGATVACVVTEASAAGWCWLAWRGDGGHFAWGSYPSAEECDGFVHEQVASMAERGWALIERPRVVVVAEPPATDDDGAALAWCQGLWTTAGRG